MCETINDAFKAILGAKCFQISFLNHVTDFDFQKMRRLKTFFVKY